MRKKFVTNLALLLFMNLMIKPFWVLFIDRKVQMAVGTENFGIYFALFNFTFLMNIILDFGITNFNNKNIAQNNHLLTKHFSSLFVLKLMLAVIYIIITLIAGFFVGYDFRYIKLVLILGFNQFLISLIMYLRSNIAGLHLFKTDSIISILDRSIMIAICLFLLYGNILDKGHMDIMHYVYAQTFAYIITAFIAFIVVVKKADFFKLKLSFPFSLMMLKKSFPYAVLVLLMTFYNRIDAVMLERLLGENGKLQSGIYAQGYRLLDATNMIAFLFAGLLLPIFSRMLKYKESVEALIKLAFTLLITPAIVIAIGCIFYQNELMTMLYFDKNNPEISQLNIIAGAPVFATLMCCFSAICTTYIFGTLLTANGNMRELNLMAGCGMLANVILNFILIPRFYALGSAVASLVTQSLMAFIQVVLVQYTFKFKINFKLLLRLLLFTLGVLLTNFISKQYHYNEKFWYPNFIIMVIVSVCWAFIVGLLNIKGMLRIMKYG